ncbi:MAG: hypothetical protein SXQ77_05725, partial [Halobacteria archaeon]|nr:hypothetical protein [Halobacteria archaeon]
MVFEIFPLVSDTTKGLGFSALGLVVGLGIFAYGFIEYKKRSLIQNTPTSKIRSMPIGPVEV